MEKRIGRQTPTTSFTLPYTQTKGPDAVLLYELTGRKAQEWQQLINYDLLATNEEGLWIHAKYGYSVPRRNGKGEILIIRELYGLAAGEHILHTAHRADTSHSAWERLCEILDTLGVPYRSTKAKGRETITVEDGGRAEFRTRTAKGGLGEGFDLLVIDEAQEYQSDQENALQYVISSSKNPQTIMCGTPPTVNSSGTVFSEFRKDVLQGTAPDTGWSEWGVEDLSAVDDVDLWYETNPSLGTVLTERKIREENAKDTVDFNIQRLGHWLKYNQKSAISKVEWLRCKVINLPKLVGPLTVGVKYNRDGETVSMAIAAKTAEGKTFIEAIDCRQVRDGNGWIIDFLRSLGSGLNRVIIDGENGKTVIETELKAAKIKDYVFPTVKDFIQANARFEQAVFHETIQHMEQPSLIQVISNCEKRAVGSHGGFGYNAILPGLDISLMDAVILAAWGADEFKPKTHKQKIYY